MNVDEEILVDTKHRGERDLVKIQTQNDCKEYNVHENETFSSRFKTCP
jgi:hypothetical protein